MYMIHAYVYEYMYRYVFVFMFMLTLMLYTYEHGHGHQHLNIASKRSLIKLIALSLGITELCLIRLIPKTFELEMALNMYIDVDKDVDTGIGHGTYMTRCIKGHQAGKL
jgi:hypothetical protein